MEACSAGETMTTASLATATEHPVNHRLGSLLLIVAAYRRWQLVSKAQINFICNTQVFKIIEIRKQVKLNKFRKILIRTLHTIIQKNDAHWSEIEKIEYKVK